MKKIGILGGGQLGRMLLQAAANYPIETYVLENDPACPAAHLCHHFTQGDIKDFESVYAFGKGLDAMTIEIENVNIDALEKLEQEGVKVYPSTKVLRTIKNKILQKEFYHLHNIPTADFIITNTRTDLHQHKDFLPAVHKLAEGGYDGRGVQIIKTVENIDKGFDQASVLEKMIDIDKEIAITVAINDLGETAIYPPVEMVFDPELNMLDYQLCPASLNAEINAKVNEIASSLGNSFQSAGLFAIEMMIGKNGEVMVNETAPRVHNSGHHTIEAHYCSQFDMLWRIMMNYPLGNTAAIAPSIMVNIVGAGGFSGPVVYEGLEEVLGYQKCFIHLYGKKETKPGRKMGHATLVGHDTQSLQEQAGKIKKKLRPISI